VVVGHYHYQRVINTEPHFRRAFADVFRRRSFLFLGSGLKEDYLVNLFSEILLTFGAGSLPHYAMFTEKEAEGHADFLQSRLNVTPIVYKDHKDLPEYLKQLAEGCSKEALRKSHISTGEVPVPIGGGGRLEEHRLLCGDGEHAVNLVLRWGGLRPPGMDECVAFSAGRSGDLLPLLIGGMGQSYLNDHHPDWSEQERSMPQRVGDAQYVHQYGTDRVFAVAARHRETDARDLRTIAPAIEELLRVTATKGMRKVHAGLIAAGPSRKWHPTFSLIEMIRGARTAAETLGTRCPSLVINILDPSVWFPLQAQKLSVDDILAGPNVKFWAESQPLQGERLRLLCVRSESEKVSDVARLFGFKQGSNEWVVEVRPRPSEAESPSPLNAAWGKDLTRIGVVHGSTLLFHEVKTDL